MSNERLEIDHVVLGVADLDLAAANLLDEHGLVALPGGRHPKWGTANRIVPLGSTYLELVAVVDPEVAAESGFGGWVAGMAARGGGWGWAVRTGDIEATAARLQLRIEPGSRVTADGAQLRWRLAGLPTERSDPAVPFFISWDAGTPLPGTAHAPHRGGDAHLVGLTIEGGLERLPTWLGDADLPIDVIPGDRGVVAVEIATNTRTIRLLPRRVSRAVTAAPRSS